MSELEFKGEKTREWKNGRTELTGTRALGSFFNEEFDRLYENDNYLEEKKLDKEGGTISGNLAIGGNLSVSGAVINEAELAIQDKIITLNKGEPGPGVSGDGISGIVIERGKSEKNALIVFDESDAKIKIGLEGNLAPVATEAAVSAAQNTADSKINLSSNVQTTASTQTGLNESGTRMRTHGGLSAGTRTLRNLLQNLNISYDVLRFIQMAYFYNECKCLNIIFLRIQIFINSTPVRFFTISPIKFYLKPASTWRYTQPLFIHFQFFTT